MLLRELIEVKAEEKEFESQYAFINHIIRNAEPGGKGKLSVETYYPNQHRKVVTVKDDISNKEVLLLHNSYYSSIDVFANKTSALLSNIDKVDIASLIDLYGVRSVQYEDAIIEDIKKKIQLVDIPKDWKFEVVKNSIYISNDAVFLTDANEIKASILLACNEFTLNFIRNILGS